MFPGTTYGNNSGGDPESIVDLTYQELLQFHKTHYHPSNAKFYTYGRIFMKHFYFFNLYICNLLNLLIIYIGNFPLRDHLIAIDNKIKEFGKLNPDEGVKIVEPFDSPRRIHLYGPLDPSK